MQQKKRKKKGGGKNIPRESIYGLHAAASSMPVISLWVKEGSLLCANWRPCIETMGGTWDMGKGWVQVVAIIKTLQWRCCFAFWPGEGGGAQGWCSDAC